MSFKKAIFTIGHESNFTFKGIYNPQVNWNGWLCPYFNYETAKQICQTQDIESCKESDLSYYSISEYPKGIIEHHSEGIEFTKCITFEGVDYYPIGGFNWVWEKVTFENEISEISENVIDEIFNDICNKLNLKSGDITPCQNNELEDIKSRLFRLLVGYVERNIQG